MWSIVKKYLYIYKENFSTSLAEATTYRANFILSLVMELTICVLTLSTVSFIFDHVEKIGYWNEHQFLFFISFVLMVNQIHMAFISLNFWMFSEDIIQGTLDFKLLKPVSSIFLVFFRYIRVPTIPNIIFTSWLIFHYGSKLNFGFLEWILIPLLLVLSLTLMVSLEILMMISNFWLIDGFGINFLRMQFQNLSRWPDFVFSFYSRKILTFAFPILLVNSAPIRFLFDHSQWLWLVTLVGATLISWVAIYFLWQVGLNRYESASS